MVAGRWADTVIARAMALLWTRPRIAAWLCPRLFLDPPEYEFDADRRAEFESLYRSAVDAGDGTRIRYRSPYPKHEFLAYLSSHKPVVFHGSNVPGVEAFEPRQQTTWDGEPTTAVFGTKDPVWSTFFAVVDREEYRDSLRNGGFLVRNGAGRPDRYYYFSLSGAGLRHRPWTDGTVYLLPEGAFDPPEYDVLGFDEWRCAEPVRPLAALPVAPADFPYLDDVVGHDEREPGFASMAKYRYRRRRDRR